MAGLDAAGNFHGTPTVLPNPMFNAEQSAAALKKAFKGIGTDEALVIKTLAEINSIQRGMLATQYKVQYGEDLIAALKSELSGDFLKVCLAAMTNPIDYDAQQLRSAMKGLGTDEELLIEILATRTNPEVRAIAASYKAQFQRDLEADLVDETSGKFKKFLVAVVQGSRSDMPADRAKAIEQARALYAAGEGKWGTDESEFHRILMTASPAQLRAVCAEYTTLSSKDFETVLQSEFSGDLLTGFLAVVKVARNAPAYFAERLHKSMKGMGTNDSMLIRLIVARSERDLVEVKQAFQIMYGKTLGWWIKDETSGDYKNMLLALAREV